MASPIYFFPRVPLAELFTTEALNKSRLGKYDLADVIGDVAPDGFTRMDFTGKGPGNASGAMLIVNSQGKTPPHAGYYPEFQQWTKVRIDPELWIGIDNEYPPVPADLARPNQVEGHLVTLADGHGWQVPVIRNCIGDTKLPCDMYRGPDGEMQGGIKPAFQGLWEDTRPVWDMLFGGDDKPEDDGDGLSNANNPQTMPFGEILDLCVRFLGVNYRFGHAEQAVLRPIDSMHATWQSIFVAVVDGPFLEAVMAAQKKRDNSAVVDTANSKPGQPDTSPATDPAEPISV